MLVHIHNTLASTRKQLRCITDKLSKCFEAEIVTHKILAWAKLAIVNINLDAMGRRGARAGDVVEAQLIV